MENKVKQYDSRETITYSRRAIITCMLMLFTFTGMGWTALSTYAVGVVEEFGCSTAQFMTMFTILSIVNTGLSITVFGFVIQKLGTRKIILVAGLLCSAGFGIYAIASSIQFMWAGAVVYAIGLAFANIPTLNVIMTAWFKKDTAKFTGLAQCFNPAGGAVVSTALGIAMVVVGWRAPFAVSGCISVIMTIIMFVLYREPKEVGALPRGAAELMEAKKTGASAENEEVSLETGPSYAKSLRMKRTWAIFFAYVLAGIADYGLLGNFALIAANYGFADQAGFVMGFSWVAQVVSFLTLGFVTDKWGSRVSMVLCAVLVVFVAGVFLSGHVTLPLVFICGACLGFADGAVQLPMGATTREVLGTRDFAKKMGMIGGGCFLGVSFATVIVAAMFDATGSYRPAFLMVIAFSVIVSVLFWIVAKRTDFEE